MTAVRSQSDRISAIENGACLAPFFLRRRSILGSSNRSTNSAWQPVRVHDFTGAGADSGLIQESNLISPELHWIIQPSISQEPVCRDGFIFGLDQ
jgi:hypothetical protein